MLFLLALGWCCGIAGTAALAAEATGYGTETAWAAAFMAGLPLAVWVGRRAALQSSGFGRAALAVFAWPLMSLLGGIPSFCLLKIIDMQPGGSGVFLYLLGQSPPATGPLGLRLFGLSAAAAASAGLVAATGAFMRALWLRGLRRNARNLACSKARSAAAGLVEVCGTAAPCDLHPASKPLLGCAAFPEYGRPTEFIVAPFWLDDGTGRVLIEPSGGLDEDDPHLLLRADDVHGQPVLRARDEVYVLGNLVPGEPSRIRPLTPRAGRPSYASFFMPEEMLLVCAGRESRARRVLAVLAAAWAAYGLFAGAGSLQLLRLWVRS